MSTGVQVRDECMTVYQELKLGKKFKYIVYKLDKNNSEIVVEKTSATANYAEFVEALPAADCRYAVYDLEFEHPEGGLRNKIVFVTWAPDTAPVRAKMIYAGSKDAIRKKLVGVATEVQATDLSEIAYEAVMDKVRL
ncbi:hypothetical protein AMAG_16320 [Allomyces macrogynus ATCC 38327]|uniref:Cofilin n=1 Tax=Allomyces macrogynus (strain ATCC 38327) TaxID=578462 RepID=A0A0L0TAW7_ALLM3|nr:hypothetical protein AMAG_08875 [Allomyces macrogynus ATCC 38327]KNE71892.1 hypothetical protein AMAG_16320 [Allomyces macrogynus ATCC 38327]|eukprot:KNE63803.1 hypothetical protein AMAG_08875 [Allomyces macrogynus ATCC 38327]